MAIDPTTKPMNLEGKVALVTGAASGIGRAIVRRFAHLGASTVVADINEDGGRETVKLVEEAGAAASFLPCDITSYADALAAVAHARATYGQLDILVNNAGWDVIRPFLQVDEPLWNRIIDINLRGPINLCHAAMTAFAEQGSGGRIVNIASDAGRVGSLGESVYSACKGGVIALTKSLAREGARQGVIVNCVAPGITDTPLVAGLEPKVIEAIVKTIPLRRMGEPEEVAELVAFVASDSNAYMTGQVISVSGGLTMV